MQAKKEKAAKLKLLKIWEILSEQTDEEHPMRTNDLIAKLAEFGVPCNRKTLYSDIDALCEAGYEIMCIRSVSNEYYVADHRLDATEVHILMDAVQASKFITPKKTAELVDKISLLAGSRRAEVLKQNTVEFNTVKSNNEGVYYSVYYITYAISHGKKIAFSYFDYDHKHKRVLRKQGKRYVVSPLATVYDDDNYYLVCADDKHEGVSHYRIDRMTDVDVLDETSKKRRKVAGFDIKKHKKTLFGMFAGERQTVTFEADFSVLDPVFDKFGDGLKISVKDGKALFSADVQISAPFFAWASGFGSKLTVIGPESVRCQMREHLAEVMQNY